MNTRKVSLIICSLLMFSAFLLPSANATLHDVEMKNTTFIPDSLTVKVGDTVRWTNYDMVPHTATSYSNVWNSGTLKKGEQYQFTFSQSGNFPYYCIPHPFQKGTIIVDENPLAVDTDTISAGLRSIVNFTLDADPVNANRNYILLSSISGTQPGTPFPGNLVTLPLNWDAITNIVLDLSNTPIFNDFIGNLDAGGTANAVFDTLGSLPPEAVGIKFYFAYALNMPWDFASNPVAVEVVP